MSQQTDPPAHRRSVLTIAGSDSGGGAGIQADLRTIVAHGLHPLTAITALTAQNTRGVQAVHCCPPDVLEAQIESAFADFDIAAVKIGMLATAEVIETVARALAAAPDLPVVLDPVMVASSGAALLDPAALEALVRHLLPRARVITPNLPEAELLGSGQIAGRAQMASAARQLRLLGASAVLLKGGHLAGGDAFDWLDEGDRTVEFRHPRLNLNGHGTGCTLSSAIACGLALGKDLEDSCRDACDYVHGALRHAYRPGRGDLAILAHDWRRPGF